MSAVLRELASLYVAMAVLLPVALLLARGALALLATVGAPLSARQSLRVGRGALLLALVLPLLANLATHRGALAEGLRSRKLPEGLLAVAVVESAVTNLPETDGNPSLAPGMRGAGVWMFIPETARRYGLEVSAAKDERLDVARETQAAAALLADLHARYSDWRLALAAYNQGERKVDQALAEGGSRDWTVLTAAGHLNDYTATVQAGLLILRNPHLLD